MAMIAGIDLGLDHAGYVAGAAFRLSKPAYKDGQYAGANNQVVTLHAGKLFAVLRSPTSRGGNEWLPIAYDTVQKALDVFSVQGVDDVSIPGAHEGDLLWWRQGNRTTLRIYVVGERTISVAASGRVLNSDGTVQPDHPAAPVVWCEAFRYFRLSQVTDDLYDAYRNMYLALEAVLSTQPISTANSQYLSLKHKYGEEGGRLYYLLETVGQTIDYSPYVEPGSADVVMALYSEQHKAIRTALFHAKTQQSPILPGSPKTRREVARALDRLSRLVMELFEHLLGVRRLRGWITPYAWERNIGGMRDTFRLAVTDCADVPSNDVDAYRAHAVLSEMHTTYLGRIDSAGYELAYKGSIPTSKLSAPVVNAIASYAGPNGLITHGTVDSLTLEGVDVLQVIQVFVVRNRGMPKSRFSL